MYCIIVLFTFHTVLYFSLCFHIYVSAYMANKLLHFLYHKMITRGRNNIAPSYHYLNCVLRFIDSCCTNLFNEKSERNR